MNTRTDPSIWLRQFSLRALPMLLAAAVALAGCDVEERVADEADEVAADTTARPSAAAEGAGAAPVALAVQTAKEGDATRQFIMYPTGQRETSMLMIEKIGPAEVRAGQPYDYQLRLTNLTSAPLAGVSLRQSLPHGVSLEAAQPAVTRLVNEPPATQPSDKEEQQQQQRRADATTRPAGQGPDQLASGAATQPSQQQGQQQQFAGGATTQPAGTQPMEFAVATWRIGELGPGQTRTINVRAFASRAGAMPSCISADYEPTLCTVTQVVNPQIRLAKFGPQRADMCEPLSYTYTVTNAGTGTARSIRIEDPLPQGLTTEDGKQQVALEAGDVPAGETKRFAVKLRATRAGEFASRAVAASETDKVFSDKLTTTIVRPNLAVTIDAPESQYINERFTYRVTVTNNGTAPAEDAVLKLDVGDGAQLVRIPTMQPAAEGDAELAAARDGGGEEAAVAAGDESAEAVRVGTLHPGQSKTLRLTFIGREEGQTAIGAMAVSECAQPAEASARTYIATIPALQLWVVDAQDPVKVGGETTYVVRLLNEGSGAAKNITLSGNLPKAMTFVSGTGDSTVKVQGQNVTFGPIESLPAGQQLEWRVRAKADEPGDAQFRVQLKSDDLTKAVVSSEPTKLYQ